MKTEHGERKYERIERNLGLFFLHVNRFDDDG